MSKELPEEIKIAIDRAIENFLANEDDILRDKSQTMKHKYKAISSLKNWRKSQKCMVKDCPKKSISKSHTIQKSASIQGISENGHLLYPVYDEKKKVYTLKLIGINEASTFPGYCKEHENLFEGFESIKDIQTKEHLGLQIYRTICREIFSAKNEIKLQSNYIKEYKALRSKKIADKIENSLKGKYPDIDKINFASFVFKGMDERLKVVTKQLNERKENLNSFLLKFHDAVLNDIKKKKFQKLAYQFIVFPEVIPVALAGRGSFEMKLKTKTKNVNIVFNVLPYLDKTYVFVTCLKKYKSELDAYMINCNSGLQLINRVEYWMIFNTNHWFLKPSIWKKINDSDKKEILDSILNGSQNIGGEYGKTIFNEIKLKAIKIIENQNKELPDSHVKFIEKEKKKITLANNG